MPAILRSPVWPDPRRQPPFGAVEIDWSHPLARGLSSFLLPTGASVVVDLMGRLRSTRSGSTSSGYLAGMRAAGAENASSSLQLQPLLAPGTFPAATGTGLTSLLFYNRLGLASGNNRTLISGGWWALRNLNTTDDVVVWGDYNGPNPTTNVNVTIPGASGYRATQWVAFRWSPSSLTFEVWIRGTKIAQATAVEGLDPSWHGTTWYLGGGFGSGNGRVLVAYVANWHRALTDAELVALTASDDKITEQFSFLRPVVRRRWFVSAAGAEFAAAISGTATVAGALSTTITLGAAASATVNATASLTTAITVGASLSATASAAANLTNAITLATAVSASATASAGLATAITLAAQAPATATVVADLTGGTGGILFNAALTAGATKAGALTTAITLGAAASASANVAGGLTTAIHAAATVPAAATVAGTLTTVIAAAAAVSATATTAGSLTTAIVLAGAAPISAAVAADLLSGRVPGLIRIGQEVLTMPRAAASVLAVPTVAREGLEGA